MKDTDSTLAQFDQAGAERLEKIYLTPDVVQQREQIFQLLDVKPGMHALDIGCGPGLTSLSLAVYEYVADVDSALRELWRVMKPGAQVLLVDTDWESCVWACRDETRMRRMMQGWSQHIPHPQLPRTLIQRMQGAGFADVQAHTIPLMNMNYSTDTFSGGMMGFIASFVGGLPDFGPQLAVDWQADVQTMKDAGGYFFSLNRFVFVARKPLA